jgi:predicted nucleotidyltransferase
MLPTPYPHINAMLDSLLSEMQHILGDKLVGLYLYGSLVMGDFDNESSDIDLLAATTTDIDDQDFDALHKMHDDFAEKHKNWEGRIEVKYLSVAALRTFKSQTSKIASISPGEPFHVIEAGKHYAANWYVVQEKGITLFGPSPRTIIDPISQEEFIQTVRDHVEQWREWVQISKDRPSQAYAILTMCRALYTCTHGEQVSKKRAALWTQQYLPQWASLIADALKWRAAWREEPADAEATFPETVRFVHFVIDLIAHLPT